MAINAMMKEHEQTRGRIDDIDKEIRKVDDALSNALKTTNTNLKEDSAVTVVVADNIERLVHGTNVDFSSIAARLEIDPILMPNIGFQSWREQLDAHKQQQLTTEYSQQRSLGVNT